MKADIGVIGLAVMGQNLVLNFIDNNYHVAVYNRSSDKTNETINRTENKSLLHPTYSLPEFVNNLAKPRKILLLIKAGKPVDDLLSRLIPLLEPGDLIIDGGNSNYLDTQRRFQELDKIGIHFIGMGISGGESGARYGPSLMPGGSSKGWKLIEKMFIDISAKANSVPCCAWIGNDGAGHFVKTIHNGIEYGDMQLISEAYDILRNGLGLTHGQIADIFEKWNQSFLHSYLIEITSTILNKIDKLTGTPLVDQILDSAGQKGTGKWTAIVALEMGVPVSLIASAVFQRFLSSLKNERVQASELYNINIMQTKLPTDIIIKELEYALYTAKIISYTQGFALLYQASSQYEWDLDLGTIASIWRAGCIIRSSFLDDISKIFETNPNLSNLLMSDYFSNILKKHHESLRYINKLAIDLHISVPGFSSALSYFDGYIRNTLPANLIQAQRDYFGSHGYIRTDTGEYCHTNWEL